MLIELKAKIGLYLLETNKVSICVDIWSKKGITSSYLHLFLHTSDILIDLLIVELQQQDTIEKVKKFSSLDLTSYRHINMF